MEIIEWIKAGLEKPGKTQSGLAKALGRYPSAVTSLLKGEREVKVTEIATIAAYLEEPPPQVERTFRAPVMGFVGAGAEINVDVEQVPKEGFYDIDTIIPLPSDVIAFEVVGESMQPKYEPGDVIVCYRESLPIEAVREGIHAAVELDDGRRFLKKLHKQPDGTFWLESHNASPIFNVRVTWASDVLATIPATRWSKVTNGHRKSRLKA